MSASKKYVSGITCVCFVLLMYPIYNCGYLLGKNRTHEQIAALWDQWFSEQEPESERTVDDSSGDDTSPLSTAQEINETEKLFGPATPAKKSAESAASLDDLFE